MTAPVFFRPEMSALNAGSYSPSAGKPALVVKDWLDRGLIEEGDIETFEPVTRDDLALAHERRYVDDVLEGKTVNGFGNTDPQVADSLLYTTGSMLAAAEHAVIHGRHTCSPTSGFHHAGHAFGGGFCTFNGLMVAALKLKKEGLIDTVSILDCDMHYGDGTQDIIDRLGIKWIRHHTFGEHFRTVRDIGGPNARRFFDWLDDAVDDCRKSDLVLYQAGADPHRLDPLGGLLSSAQLVRRDEQVASGLRGKPLAWNLAGGYQRDERGGIRAVLDLHEATARQFACTTPRQPENIRAATGQRTLTLNGRATCSTRRPQHPFTEHKQEN